MEPKPWVSRTTPSLLRSARSWGRFVPAQSAVKLLPSYGLIESLARFLDARQLECPCHGPVVALLRRHPQGREIGIAPQEHHLLNREGDPQGMTLWNVGDPLGDLAEAESRAFLDLVKPLV